MKRRTFITTTAGLVAAAARPRLFAQAPAFVTSERVRPRIDYGVGAGDPAGDRAVVWAHVDRPAQMVEEYATTESFANARRVTGALATPDTGLTGRLTIGGLRPGQDVFYRVSFEDLADPRVVSEPQVGRFRTAPDRKGAGSATSATSSPPCRWVSACCGSRSMRASKAGTITWPAPWSCGRSIAARRPCGSNGRRREECPRRRPAARRRVRRGLPIAR